MPQDPTPRSGAEPWRMLRTDERALADTRLTLHHAVQLLASFGQALVEPRADDSHRSMTLDAGNDAFRSEATTDGLRASLTVPNLTLALWGTEGKLTELSLTGRSLTEAQRWLADAVTRARSSPTALVWPDYDLPERSGGRDTPLGADAEGLTELAAWFGNAALLLEDVAGTVPEASEVRCWPHHFDLATLLTFPAAGPDGTARYVGLGLSPGDASREDPYYYVNGWPAPSPADLKPLSGAGAWNTEGWVGAVLTAGEVVGIADVAAQRAMVEAFLSDAVSAMLAAVLGEP